jgi:integrase
MSARGERLLTAREVASATKPGRYADGGGLYLAVSDGGRRRWVWQFQWRGKTREMGLGSASQVTLKEARDERDKWRAVLQNGRDPIAEREAQRLASIPVPTFGTCADEFIASKEPEWSNGKHVEQWKRTLKTYAKPLRGLPVNEVTTTDILAVLKPIWLTKPETASRVRGRIETVLDYARVSGHRSEHVANPARWRGHLAMLLPGRQKLSRRHHPALPYAEIPGFVADLREQPGMSALALEFTILTVARSGETLGALKTEIRMKDRVWIVPPARMKGKREHRVPLSDAAMQVVEQALTLSTGDYLFAGARRGRPLSNMAMEMLLRRMEIEDATVHGMRSSFRDWAGDETHFPREVIEAALAHAVGDKAEQAYRRSDALEKRRKLMDAWASYCSSAPADNVVKLFERPDAG